MRIFLMALVALLAIPFAAQADDAELGKDIFMKRCKVCHNTSADRKIGPGMQGVYGRQSESEIGSLTEETLHKWLQDPRSLKNNTRMPKYPDMQEQAKRQAVIDFLKTLH